MPVSAECCGFAGDRGFLVPELTASAAAKEGSRDPARLDGAPGPPGVLDLPDLRDRDGPCGRPARALGGPPRARGRDGCLTASSTGSCSSRPCRRMRCCPLSALENVFPPVPADVAVAVGAFLSQQGRISAWLLGLLCWTANQASACAVYFFARARGPEFFAHGHGRRLLPPEAFAALKQASDRYGIAWHLRLPVPARPARRGLALCRGHRNAAPARPGRGRRRLGPLVRLPDRGSGWRSARACPRCAASWTTPIGSSAWSPS